MPFRFDSFLGESDGAPPFVGTVEFLAGFEGADGATTYTEESPNELPMTFLNQCELDTAQSKFGSSSVLSDGTDDAVFTAQDNALNLGSGHWTLEGWIRLSATNSSFRFLMGSWQTSGFHKSYALYYDGTGDDLELFLSVNGSSTITQLSAPFFPSVGVWYAVAADFDGTTYRLYLDGAVQDTSTTLRTLDPTSVGFSVAGQPDGNDSFLGHVDEVRLTKDFARYAGAYTPSGPFFPR